MTGATAGPRAGRRGRPDAAPGGWRAVLQRANSPGTRPLLVGAVGLLLVATVGCLLAGRSPWLPVVLALLAVAALRPMVGLGYALVVFGTSLGLWATGVQGLVGSAFGGRDYALNLSAVAVVFIHAARTVVRWRLSHRQLIAVALAGLVLGGSVLVGLAQHGPAQTLLGVRFVLLPLAFLAVVAALPGHHLEKLIGVLSWLLVANAVAAIGEFAVGPARLWAWGLDRDRAIRYIDGHFRAPGLTEFNAVLGMLAGAYLLGYLGLWLTRDVRPGRWSWHAGAVAAAVCLALSTSRSGAVLVAGGVVAAAVLNRGGGAAGRRRGWLLGLGVLGLVPVGFVAVGATGVDSLLQRFEVWASLLGGNVPLYGLGIGAAGAATNSRAAAGPEVFVDNYYVSVALQFGPVLLVGLLALLAAALAWLVRRSADRPSYVLHIAVLAGLAGSALVIENWEYPGAMAALALFVAHGLHADGDRARKPDERPGPGPDDGRD